MTVLLECETDKEMGTLEKNSEAASDEVQLMDEKFELLCDLFHQAYRTPAPSGFDPVQRSQDRAFLDEESQTFAARTSMLIEDQLRNPTSMKKSP
ncbi:MAG: hypothetical protein Q9208_008283 [Pyrenodesmia sp. 3 TL-2023]